ncbi:ribosome maturation factor RimM [Novosphingobium sp.]|uniref:ribosome maturation factor RimM n=1 Tax=Novosphingobium sp. TaxID=1874826 RepID=UPI0033400774
MGNDRPVTLAAVIGAHGIAGDVRLKLFGDGVAALKRHLNHAGAFNAGKLTLTVLRDDGKGGAIARFAECPDRNAAEALRGTALAVPRSTLPPLADGEYYHADLLGLPAISTDGDDLGICVAIDNFGAGDVIEVRRPDGKSFMVPMRVEAVPEWDDQRMVITTVWAQD